jgi:anti-sigma regulatory factor (Ser/Thr protein kinase)/serine/threonine protein phosphatase PrpC
VAHEIITVSGTGDVYPAQATARQIAAQIGFDSRVSEEIVLVVTELVTNLVRHAGGGNLILTSIFEHGRSGIQIESHDNGPGMTGLERIFADGYSTASGPGYGLGTINRLMDELDITTFPAQQNGAHVVCRRWVREVAVRRNSFAIGVASRPHPLMPVNGDSFVVKQWEQSALVAVIDGLGHGQEAHRAAETARQYVETHFDMALSSIFVGVSRACVGTRGVVMAIARFDRPQLQFTFASLGNVEARICNSSEPAKLLISRGILGHTNKRPFINEHSWNPNSVFVLHSDGLSSRWHCDDFAFEQSPAAIARELLHKLARKEDDATVIVVKRATE